MGLVEIKVRLENLAITCRSCLPSNWDYLHNIGLGVVARVIFTSNSLLINVTLLSSSMQHITSKVEHATSLKVFVVSMVYGMNSTSDRRLLWSGLRELHPRANTVS